MSPDPDQIWTVSRLNTLVRDTLFRERRLQQVWLKGEIFNLTRHASGHIYFSLKDDKSVINCTFFKNQNARYRNVPLQEGLEVQARGGVSVYPPRGSYQFNVTDVMPAGEGALRLRIEELRRRLHAEGLFDPSKKKPLPVLPITLGVATAETGAAIRDIVQVARRRFPRLNILLAPCVVQGRDAPASIVRAIEWLNRPEFGVDVIIAGRGGGSFEDLLPFNEESVVRAYAGSRVPIVSAVGHEIDTPMSDLAADRSAPTPSAAAELAIPELAGWVEFLGDCALRLQVSLRNRYRTEKARLEYLLSSHAFQAPRTIMESAGQGLDLAWRDLQNAMRAQLKAGSARLKDSQVLTVLFHKRLSALEHRFELAGERLGSFSPLAVLGRGYAVARKGDGTVLRNATDASPGDEIRVLLGSGSLDATVNTVDRGSADAETQGQR